MPERKSLGARRLFKTLLPALMRPEITLLLAILVLSVYFQTQNPSYGTWANIQNVLRWVAIYAIIAVGEMFVIISGGIDLSVGSVVALTGMVSAFFMVNLQIPLFIAVVLTLAVAALIGFWHGFFVGKFSPPLPHIVPSFLVTLTTLFIGRGLAQYITSGYPIAVSASDFPTFIFVGRGTILSIPFPVILLVVAVILSAYVLNFSVWGRHIYAVGGNLQAARVSGIGINRMRILCYMICSVLAGLAGMLVVGRLQSAWPGVGSGYELTAIGSCVLGGVSLAGGAGTSPGVILGVALVAIIENGLVMMNVSPYLHQITIGAILVVAVSIDFIRRFRKG